MSYDLVGLSIPKSIISSSFYFKTLRHSTFDIFSLLSLRLFLTAKSAKFFAKSAMEKYFNFKLFRTIIALSTFDIFQSIISSSFYFKTLRLSTFDIFSLLSLRLFLNAKSAKFSQSSQEIF
jgi:hypothetical protein